MRNNNISQDGCAWENNLEVWSTSIFSAEALVGSLLGEIKSKRTLLVHPRRTDLRSQFVLLEHRLFVSVIAVHR